MYIYLYIHICIYIYMCLSDRCIYTLHMYAMYCDYEYYYIYLGISKEYRRNVSLGLNEATR